MFRRSILLNWERFQRFICDRPKIYEVISFQANNRPENLRAFIDLYGILFAMTSFLYKLIIITWLQISKDNIIVIF